jgi:hypothetical protein
VSVSRTHVDVDEVEITKTEKLLAVVLAVFFLIGGLWAYTKLDEIGRSEYRPAEAYFTTAERTAVAQAQDARQRLARATAIAGQARQDLELAREAYRTALDAGRSAPRLETAYRDAQRAFDRAQTEERTARAEMAAAQPAADAAYERANEEAFADTRQSELLTFLYRLALLVAMLGAAFWLLVRLRRSNSRYLPIAFAFVGGATVLALVMAGDYVTDYIDVQELGPLVLSLSVIEMSLVELFFVMWYVV